MPSSARASEWLLPAATAAMRAPTTAAAPIASGQRETFAHPWFNGTRILLPSLTAGLYPALM